MGKKVLSIILAIMMIIGILPAYAQESETNITVYLTVSRYGEIVKDKNGDDMVHKEVNLSGKSSYTIDDAFSLAHEMYHQEGIDGYASSTGDWGLGVDKLWGDTSYNFGYQVNGGNESVSGPGHILEDGDYIDAVIYKNLYPDTESYAKFNTVSGRVYGREEFLLTLSAVSGYDDSWNMIFSPCEGATITVNGQETEHVTDEFGVAGVMLENDGVYVISAKKEKVLNEQIVPAITAPVCVVEVTGNSGSEEAYEPTEIIHNIAGQYAQISLENAGGNLPWIVADMAIYEELFGESRNVLSNEKKQEALLSIVNSATEATTAGDLAKSILALRALGYDSSKIYTNSFEKKDIVKSLAFLVESGDTAVTNIYTLPYVIIALSQAEGYLPQELMDGLIASAVESKALWQDTEFGTDALTPMVLALAPYYSANEDVKNVIDEAVEILKSKQREDGLIDGFEGYEPASTGLAICALSALGIDCCEIKACEINLIDGLLSTINEEQNAFPNAFATEQGFRGLLAWQLLINNKGKNMYDFSDYPMREINLSGANYCPVVFNVMPDNAVVEITGVQPYSKNTFDLNEGEYSYSVSAQGYFTITGTITVTQDDAQNRILKKQNVSLPVIDGGGGVSIKESTDDEKEDPKEEQKEETKEETPVNKPVFASSTFPDVSENDWHYNSVKYVYENKLFSGTDKGFEPDASMTRAMLVTVLHRLAGPTQSGTNSSFSDIPENAWYADSVKWAAENKIISGVSDTQFAPDDNITREQIAVIIYRFALYSGYNVNLETEKEISSYGDLKDVSDYAADAMRYALASGIINGREENAIAPKEKATRAEVATMLMRFAEVVK